MADQTNSRATEISQPERETNKVLRKRVRDANLTLRTGEKPKKQLRGRPKKTVDTSQPLDHRSTRSSLFSSQLQVAPLNQHTPVRRQESQIRPLIQVTPEQVGLVERVISPIRNFVNSLSPNSSLTANLTPRPVIVLIGRDETERPRETSNLRTMDPTPMEMTQVPLQVPTGSTNSPSNGTPTHTTNLASLQSLGKETAVMLQLIDKIPTFTGLPSEDYQEWVQRLAAVLKAADIPKPIALKIIPARLFGRAAECYNSMSKRIKQDGIWRDKNYKEVIEDLGKALRTPRPAGLRLADCYNRKKKDHESIFEYATAIKKVVQQAFEEQDSKSLECKVIQFFIAGLPISIGKHLYRQEFQTLEQAVGAALAEEGIQKLERAENLSTINHTINAMTNQEVEAISCNLANLKMQPQMGRGDFRTSNPNRPRQWNQYRNQRGRFPRTNNPRSGYRRDGNSQRNQPSQDDRRREDNQDRQRNTNWRIRSGFRRTAFNLTLIATMIMFSVLLTSTQGYQICEAQAVPTFIEMPKPMNCSLTEIESIHEAKIDLFVPRVAPIIVEATRCRKVISETCTKSLFYMQTSTAVTKNTFEAMDQHECMEMIRKFNQKPWSLQVPDPPRQFMGTGCNTTKQIEITNGTIAYNHRGQMISTLGTLKGCSPHQHMCTEQNRTIVWTTPDGKGDCWIQKRGTFRATWSLPKSMEKHETIILIPELTAAFIQSTEPVTEEEKACTAPNAIKLSQGAIAVFVEGESPEIEMKRRKRGGDAEVKKAKRRGENITIAPPFQVSTDEELSTSQITRKIKNSLNSKVNSSISPSESQQITAKIDQQSTKEKQEATEADRVKATTKTSNHGQPEGKAGRRPAEPRFTRNQDETNQDQRKHSSLEELKKRNPFGSEIDVKLQYMEEKIQSTINLAFDDSFISICSNENEIRRTAIFLAQLRPTWAARLLLDRNDVAAVFAGANVLAVTQCAQVSPEKIYYSKKINDTCYLQTPIQLNGELWFAADGTEDLSRKGKEVDCSLLKTPPIYKTSKGWTDGTHRVHVFPIDTNVYQRKHAELLLFNAPEVFDIDTELILADPFEPLANIEARIDKLEVITIGSMASNVVDAAKKATKVVKNMADTVVEKAQKLEIWPFQNVFDFLETLPKIAKTVLIVMIIALIWYIYPWISPFLRCRRSAKRAGQEINAIPLIHITNKDEDNQPRHPADEYDYVPTVYSITNNRGQQLPHVNVKIGNEEYQALVDTGASASIIKTLEALKLIQNEEATLVRGEETMGNAVNNTKIKFDGAIKTEISLGNEPIKSELTLFMTEKLPSPILLGIDTWRTVKASIDLANNKIKTTNGTINIFTVETTHDGISGRAFLPFGATLQPGDNFLRARTSNLDMEKTYMTQKADTFRMENLDIAETVFHGSQQDEVPVRIINRTNNVINIPPLTKIVQIGESQIETDSENDIHHINEITVGPTEYLSPEADVTEALPGKKEQAQRSKTQHVMEQIDWSNINLSKKNKTELKRIITRQLEAFVGPDKKPGNFKGPITHKIDLIDPTIVTRQAPYKIPYNLRDELKAILDNLLESQIIRPSTSPFQAPIIMVKKNNGTYRLAIDYRRLNKNIRPAASSIASVEDILNSIGNKKIFTVLDLQNAYHSIHVNEEDVEKLAFGTPFGSFTYNRSPFGLVTSPAVFQQALSFALKDVKACVYHYVDDIIIASDTEEEHLKDIEETLAALVEYGLKASAAKAQFGRESVTYLGLKIEDGTVTHDPAKTDKITKIQPPKTQKELKSLLALFSYRRRFVKNFASMSAPLFDLLQKGRDAEKEWTEEHTKILEKLKTAITTAPALIIPNLKEPFTLETDGSKEGIGAALMQEKNGVLHPVAYFSRKTNKYEKHYSAAELETLAVVAAVDHFKHYIINNGQTTVITDSTNVCSLMKRPANEGRMGRFQVALFPYQLIFKHRAGKMNTLCDHLSRFPDPERKAPEPEEIITFLELRSGRKPHTTLEEIKKEQKKEYNWLFQIILTNTGWPTNEKEKEKLQEDIQHFLIKKGVIHRSNVEEDTKDRPLIPYNLRQRIITEFHSDPFSGGHMGPEKMTAKLKERAWWPNMTTDIIKVIKSCKTCQTAKTNPGDIVPAETRPIETPARPFQRVHVDTMGPIPSTGENQFNHILVIRDALTRFTILEPIKNLEAIEIVTMIEQQFISIFGVPESIVTDNHRSLTGKEFKKLEMTYGIKHITTCPYNPSANGIVERINKVIMDGIKQNADARNWHLLVKPTMLAINSSICRSTHTSPFYLIFGRDPILPIDNMWNLDREESANPHEHAGRVQTGWKIAKELSAQNLTHAAKEITTLRSARDKTTKIGDLVLFRKYVKKNKLDHRWSGPFRVIDVQQPNAVITPIDDPISTKTVRTDRLKRFNEPITLPLRPLRRRNEKEDEEPQDESF